MDLEAWVSHVQRSGDRLLYKAEKSGHYFAVFDTGDGRLSFCVRDVQPGRAGPATETSTAILDPEGKDLDIRSEPLLRVHHPFLIARYVEAQGMVITLRPGYQGDIHLIYGEGPTTIRSSGSIPSATDAGSVLLDTMFRR